MSSINVTNIKHPSSASNNIVLDASARVGIGTASPSFTNHIKQNTTYGFGLESNADDSRFLIGNVSSTWRVAATYGSTGSFQPITFFTSDLERARLDTSGRLLVGTSSSVGGGGDAEYARVQIRGNSLNAGIGLLGIQRDEAATSITAGEGIGGIVFSDNAGGQFASIVAAADATAGTNDYPGRLVLSTTADGASSPTEHLRITQAGGVKMSTNGSFVNSAAATHEAYQSTNNFGLVVRCTNGSFATDAITIDVDRNTTSSTYNFIVASCTGVANRFIVRDSGNVVNVNNSYGAISDIKLKENIVDANSQWDDLKAFQVRNYNFKEDQTHTQIGLIAQEVELVSPGLVTESPDRDEEGNDLGTVTKSVNYSVLYMKAVKALQEAMERIEVLEQRLTDAGIA